MSFMLVFNTILTDPLIIIKAEKLKRSSMQRTIYRGIWFTRDSLISFNFVVIISKVLVKDVVIILLEAKIMHSISHYAWHLIDLIATMILLR